VFKRLVKYSIVVREAYNMEDRRGAYRVLVGKPKGKRSLGKLRRRWEDNIRMAIK
jgi:hypothetical protein